MPMPERDLGGNANGHGGTGGNGSTLVDDGGCGGVLAGWPLTLGHTLASLVRVGRHSPGASSIRRSDGTVVAVTDRDLSPFSWMHYIVMSRSDYDHPDAAILAHERAHIRLKHSWDVMLVDVLSSPAMVQSRVVAFAQRPARHSRV